MSYQIDVPDSVYQYARKIAEETAQSTAQVIINHLLTLSAPLPSLSPDDQAELDALAFLSDDTLHTLAGEQLPKLLQSHMADLMDKNSLGTLTLTEHEELERLVARGERLMLRKAEAARLLHERNYKIISQIMKPTDG